jgi:hypothetical protein
MAQGGGSKAPVPHDRASHAAKLKQQLTSAQVAALQRKQELQTAGLDVKPGLYLEFTGEPGQELALKSLESRRTGIELVASFLEPLPEAQGAARWVEHATVFIPEGKADHFVQRVEEYRTQNLVSEKTGEVKPKNQALVDSIGEVRRTALRSFWTDAPSFIPNFGEVIWWEVWLRGEDVDVEEQFRRGAARVQLQVASKVLHFPDRTVLLAKGTPEQVLELVDALNLVAELRRAKDVASDYLELSPQDKAEWIRDLQQRTTPPVPDAPAVCILDTGVNSGHALLTIALPPLNQHSYRPDWGVDDHDGHGTEMAGLALYGDLTEALGSQGPIHLSHCLESVKILPPSGSNLPELYGAITTDAIAQVELTAPQRSRAICMCITTDGRDQGQPSSWSAEVDRLCSGTRDEQRRLVLISAGNTDPDGRKNYPYTNATDSVQDPAQSWNAVTVGACTHKISITNKDFKNWLPVAPNGGLSPCSTTGQAWERKWPNKPDIVMEGGNMGCSPAGEVDYVDSLGLLTTHYQPAPPFSKPLVPTGDTSAATAMAARMAAQIQAAYPDLWPETVRGLMVHSADWTPALLAPFGKLNTVAQRHALLGWCGYGIPNLERALWSAGSALTLIVQDSLQPFDKTGQMKEFKLYNLPWPHEQLMALGDTKVELRVTLSYFIEPDPGRRGYRGRHEYASHGLRFEMINSVESLDKFKRRISLSERDDQKKKGGYARDKKGWALGPGPRERGSIHSDRWRGMASDLVRRRHIAIYPVSGWWKDRAKGEPWRKHTRYSLLVSITTPATDVDIYTPVRTQLEVPIAIT